MSAKDARLDKDSPSSPPSGVRCESRTRHRRQALLEDFSTVAIAVGILVTMVGVAVFTISSVVWLAESRDLLRYVGISTDGEPGGYRDSESRNIALPAAIVGAALLAVGLVADSVRTSRGNRTDRRGGGAATNVHVVPSPVVRTPLQTHGPSRKAPHLEMFPVTEQSALSIRRTDTWS
ncbi:hypothetical protein [Rhodococcus sp. KRD162]|jgi:hypothetical protein|uniref:Transmembrane protein n=1 Tax=Rhodococcus baikonurensis TaxID=172041 RepID=A0ABV5XD53_9NOCA|nr:hypothetical protein [Rhodococcus sp. KRD162]